MKTRPSEWRRRRVALAAAVLLGAGAAAGAAGAQTEPADGSTLEGTVLSSRTGRALQAAEVLLFGPGERLAARALTDSAGRFVLGELAEGRYRLRVRHVGRTTRDREIELGRTEVKKIELRVAMPALRIEDLEVAVDRRATSHRLRGFNRRRERGHGYFIGPEEIREMQPRYASDVLRNVPGLTIGPDGYAEMSVLGTRSARRCEPAVWVDGQELRGYRLDNLEPDDLMAVEVFRGRSEIPTRFWRPEGQCAAIVVWTWDQGRRRDGGRDEPGAGVDAPDGGRGPAALHRPA